MSTEEQLIAAILAEPTDQAARLVYADWLEERGDERGAFVRLRVEMDALPVTSDRYWELKPRSDGLAANFDAGWVERLGYAPRYRPLFTTLPPTRKKRWRLVRLFIELWHGPLTEADGASEEELQQTEERLGAQLPVALREWYALAGRRTGIWSRQDTLLELEQLRFDAERDALIIRWENQHCEVWGIRREDLAMDDPPVYALLEEPTLNSPSITAFAAQQLLLETMWTGAVFATNDGGAASPEVERKLIDSLQRCELPDTYWVLTPVQFFEGADLYVVATPGDGFVYLAARTQQAYHELDDDVRRAFPQQR